MRGRIGRISGINLDQPEMVEQLQRWRHRPPPDVVIEPEVNVGHARAAAVADGPLDRGEHPARAPWQRRIGRAL